MDDANAVLRKIEHHRISFENIGEATSTVPHNLIVIMIRKHANGHKLIQKEPSIKDESSAAALQGGVVLPHTLWHRRGIKKNVLRHRRSKGPRCQETRGLEDLEIPQDAKTLHQCRKHEYFFIP